MQCRRCRKELIEEVIPGFPPFLVCVTVGCPKGRFSRLGKTQAVPLDCGREQARTKVARLLALAASTTFPGEAESARALAAELAEKHGLSI